MKKSPKHKISKKNVRQKNRRLDFFSLAIHHQIIIITCLSLLFFVGISFLVNQQAFPSHAANTTYKCDYNDPYSSTPHNGYTYWVSGLNHTVHNYCQYNQYCNSHQNGTSSLSNLCQLIGQPGNISLCKCDANQSGKYGGSFTCNNGNVKRSCGSSLVCNSNARQSGIWPCSVPTPTPTLVKRPCEQNGGKCVWSGDMTKLPPSCSQALGSGWTLANQQDQRFQCSSQPSFECCIHK